MSRMPAYYIPHGGGPCFEGNEPIPGAERFDGWLHETLCVVAPAERERRLVAWEKAPDARAAHPREEHLLPLMVIAGAAKKDMARQAFACRAMGAPLAAYCFGQSR